MKNKTAINKNSSRVNNSMRNLIFGVLSQIIVLVLNFAVRTVFIQTLDKTYLGVNGLFSNILTVLSLMEMGFGVAITHSMYKPLADEDTQKLQVLMKFYGNVYRFLGIIVAIIGLGITPFLDFIIKDEKNIENLTLIYFLFIANSVSSYFFAYKRSILNADQKAYICSKYHYYSAIIKTVVQIIILVLFKNFLLYLIVQVLATIGENISISRQTDKMYPYLREKTNDSLPKEDLEKIKKDVGALILSRIASVTHNGTDNIIISSFIGVVWAGLLSNYTLVIGSVTMIVSQISTSLTGSLGNFIASQDDKTYLSMFKKIDFLFFWVYGFCFICFSVLLNPFIRIWIGNDFTLSQVCVFVMATNFLVEGFLQSLWAFRTTFGLFTQGKFRPLIAAGINIIASIIFVQFWGITGVLFGTTISRLLVNCWYDPYIIFKYGLKHSPKSYYLQYLFRCTIIALIYVILQLVNFLLWKQEVTVLSFALLTMITFILPNIVFWMVYRKTEEFSYFINIVMSKISILRHNFTT